MFCAAEGITFVTVAIGTNSLPARGNKFASKTGSICYVLVEPHQEKMRRCGIRYGSKIVGIVSTRMDGERGRM